MSNRYEGLLVLNTKGKDETVRETIERLEGEIKKEGGAIEQVQRMEKRQFSYAAGDLDSGYYVNFVFSGEPVLPAKLRAKFKLDPDVYRQHYQKLRVTSKVPKPRTGKPAPAQAEAGA
ncbi:MAG TPA: 30S ribosomal protein S6 [Chthoniobacterales bacterium]